MARSETPRTRVVKVLVDDQERDLFKGVAQEYGVSVSELIRNTMVLFVAQHIVAKAQAERNAEEKRDQASRKDRE